MSAKPLLVVAFSDLHVGSTVALCPPVGIALEDGGRYIPNAAQLWIWEQWLAFWRVVHDYKRRGIKVIGIMNGEFIDGFHHESTQLASASPEIMASAALDVMAVAMREVSTLYVTRGTEAHAGKGAASDYAIARELGAVADPDSGQRAAYQWRLNIGGATFDIAHHTTGSSRMTTRGNNIRAEVQDAILAGCAADVTIRSHVHTYADTGRNYWPRQGVVLPAWQLKTAFAHRVTRIPSMSVGGVLIEVTNGKAGMVQPIMFRVPEIKYHEARI